MVSDYFLNYFLVLIMNLELSFNGKELCDIHQKFSLLLYGEKKMYLKQHEANVHFGLLFLLTWFAYID